MSLDLTARETSIAPSSSQRLRTALGAAGIGTWYVDVQERRVTLDAGMSRILGLGDSERHVTVEAVLTRVHPDDHAAATMIVRDAFQRRSDLLLEARVVRPDGFCRWVRARGRFLTEDEGETVLAGAAVDITDQRRLDDRERALADVANALTSSIDYELSVAQAAERLVPRIAAACHVHLQERDGIRTFGTGRGLERCDEQVADVIQNGTALYDERRLLVPLRVGATTLGAMSLSGGVFDASDLTFAEAVGHRIALAIDRGRLLRDLQRAGRVKDEFLAALSHELRTPLNAVLGWTRMLRRGTLPPERTASVLETIERNATAQMQLVEELLDLSAMAAGALRLILTRVDLRELIGGAVETVRPAADAKGLRITMTVEGSPEVAGDATRLRQVLWNLLANAVKFTPAGGVIDVAVIESAADVSIAVQDSGPGIPPDFLPHVFEAFRQADSGSIRNAGGLGLGLAIVRHIVEAHGGTVTASSHGAGSLFTVRLPTGALRSSGISGSHESSLRGRRVLAVDDDESTQELVATMLLMYGVSVRTAGRAEQAMTVLSDWRPDVLLTDIEMPGEDGYGLMRRVRALPSPLGTTPAVALTGYTDPQSVQNAFAAGFDAHVGKPLEPHVLADALSKVLRLRA